LKSLVKPQWKGHRLVPSHFPPIAIFESIYDSEDELRIAFEIEGMTNDRLEQETSGLSLVKQGDCLFGPGTTPIMAAFTHIGFESRFTDGTYGAYYCANNVDTAIKETMYHKAKFFAATKEGDTEITMREYITAIKKPLVDVRGLHDLHKPDSYIDSQAFGKQSFKENDWGILYDSVRNKGHECAALLRPPALSPTTQGSHFRYIWNGKDQRFIGSFHINENSFQEC
jgi:RES domain